MPGKPFDRERARLAAIRSGQVRRQNREERRQYAKTLMELAKLRLEKAHEEPKYDRLRTLRNQLRACDKRISEELAKDGKTLDAKGNLQVLDGQLLNWLVQAGSKLAEQERQLSGRPLPGKAKGSQGSGIPAAPSDE